MEELTAYDLDGTIIMSPFHHFVLKKLVWKSNPQVEKDAVSIIITSRSVKDAELTWFTCKLVGLHNLTTIIFNPQNYWEPNYVSQWKVNMLNKYGITRYVDSNSTILASMREQDYTGELTCQPW